MLELSSFIYKENKMSEDLKILNTEDKPAETQNAQAAQVNQVVNNAVAALMDVANLLRDIPKLIDTQQKLLAKLVEVGAIDPKTGQFKS